MCDYKGLIWGALESYGAGKPADAQPQPSWCQLTPCRKRLPHFLSTIIQYLAPILVQLEKRSSPKRFSAPPLYYDPIFGPQSVRGSETCRPQRRRSAECPRSTSSGLQNDAHLNPSNTSKWLPFPFSTDQTTTHSGDDNPPCRESERRPKLGTLFYGFL